jgi:alkaline phosphatase D
MGEFLVRRMAAYQAYYEHMPLRGSAMPNGPAMQLYRRLQFGDLLDLRMLDTRQYRSARPCEPLGPRCAAALDPTVTMTGAEQERWLIEGLTGSSARWKAIGQQVMMAQLQIRLPGAEPSYNNDQWDGYPLARQRLLEAIRDGGVENVVVLSGDIHSAWACDLKADFASADAPVVASEFVGPSVSSVNPVAAQLRLVLPANPHIRFVDARHGYCRAELTPERWTTEFRAVETVAVPDQPAATIATWVVEVGRAGLMPG